MNKKNLDLPQWVSVFFLGLVWEPQFPPGSRPFPRAGGPRGNLAGLNFPAVWKPRPGGWTTRPSHFPRGGSSPPLGSRHVFPVLSRVTRGERCLRLSTAPHPASPLCSSSKCCGTNLAPPRRRRPFVSLCPAPLRAEPVRRFSSVVNSAATFASAVTNMAPFMSFRVILVIEFRVILVIK